MRKLIYTINISVDGCCDHAKIGGSEEVLESHTSFLKDVDLFVYGRKTYQLMIPYWPEVIKDPTSSKAEIDFAKAFNGIKKVVFSKSLKSGTDEQAAKIVNTNLQDEILKLKQEKGGDILTGGVSIPTQLMELGLIDEYRFFIHPKLVGDGRRLFEGLSPMKGLKLIESKNLKSGVTILRYEKA